MIIHEQEPRIKTEPKIKTEPEMTEPHITTEPHIETEPKSEAWWENGTTSYKIRTDSHIKTEPGMTEPHIKTEQDMPCSHVCISIHRTYISIYIYAHVTTHILCVVFANEFCTGCEVKFLHFCGWQR